MSESAGAYLSRSYFVFGSEVLDLDMRPSDAMALAVRTGTPVYLNMTLLKEVGGGMYAKLKFISCQSVGTGWLYERRFWRQERA